MEFTTVCGGIGRWMNGISRYFVDEAVSLMIWLGTVSIYDVTTVAALGYYAIFGMSISSPIVNIYSSKSSVTNPYRILVGGPALFTKVLT